jgi:hypothetical protein
MIFCSLFKEKNGSSKGCGVAFGPVGADDTVANALTG